MISDLVLTMHTYIPKKTDFDKILQEPFNYGKWNDNKEYMCIKH